MLCIDFKRSWKVPFYTLYGAWMHGKKQLLVNVCTCVCASLLFSFLSWDWRTKSRLSSFWSSGQKPVSDTLREGERWRLDGLMLTQRTEGRTQSVCCDSFFVCLFCFLFFFSSGPGNEWRRNQFVFRSLHLLLCPRPSLSTQHQTWHGSHDSCPSCIGQCAVCGRPGFHGDAGRIPKADTSVSFGSPSSRVYAES